MNDNDLDFEFDVMPNHLALDVDWVEQAGLLAKYSKLQAQADKQVAELEQALKVKRSELILACHNDLSLLGDQVKTTDKNIEAYYRTDRSHKQLKQEHIDAKYRADMLRNAVFAVQTKKIALQELDRLLLAEYFASPTGPRDLDRELARERKKAETRTESNDRVKSKLGKGRSRRTR